MLVYQSRSCLTHFRVGNKTQDQNPLDHWIGYMEKSKIGLVFPIKYRGSLIR